MEDLREFMDDLEALLGAEDEQLQEKEEGVDEFGAEELETVDVSDESQESEDKEFHVVFAQELGTILEKVKEVADEETVQRVKELSHQYIQDLKEILPSDDVELDFEAHRE